MLVKYRRILSIKQQLPAEINYEVVEHQESSAGVIDTGKNIAYGQLQVHTWFAKHILNNELKQIL